eukprot:TRINITY_DN493_c4_g1_i1.p1 TRINITY_DN493_c4_g1~~TRINITY_DN493_c4_g1_i1.p1  ORF type:complete len:254 (-),score=76.67 TRINITY_DN493_c4_g1_i1:708-1469(-)
MMTILSLLLLEQKWKKKLKNLKKKKKNEENNDNENNNQEKESKDDDNNDNNNNIEDQLEFKFVEQKKTKKQLRLEKKFREEEERRKQIEELNKKEPKSKRIIELENINNFLRPLSLRIKPIKADGNCLYNSFIDQIELSSNEKKYDCKQIRKLTADHIREHKAEFEPFIIGINDDFDDYCNTIETTNEWGGQIEIQALSSLLKKHIEIYSENEVLNIGEEFKTDDSDQSIKLAYHKYYYALGAHYNSVVKQQS